MNIKALTSKSGTLSGIIIPVEELQDVRDSIKSNTEFYKIIDDLLTDQTDNTLEKVETVFASGLNRLQVEEEAKRIADKLYTDAFRMGIPMFYKDDRIEDVKQFIRANPDGSEDLVTMDPLDKKFSLIKKLASAGQGRWSYLISA